MYAMSHINAMVSSIPYPTAYTLYSTDTLYTGILSNYCDYVLIYRHVNCSTLNCTSIRRCSILLTLGMSPHIFGSPGLDLLQLSEITNSYLWTSTNVFGTSISVNN